MRLFSGLYKRVLRWAEHPHASYYLAGVSFAESSVFFVPPDIMLTSMALARPHKAWSYAFLTTVTSVLGGMFGYFIGAYFLHLVQPYIVHFGLNDQFLEVHRWFAEWGFWAVLGGGFIPFIPYKLFTISAGALSMAFFPFVLASIVARGTRFYLEALALYYWGDRIREDLHRYIDYLGWAMLITLILAYIVYKIL